MRRRYVLGANFLNNLKRVDVYMVSATLEPPATESRSAVPIRLVYHRATEVFISLNITAALDEGLRRQRKEIERNGKNKARRPLFFNKTCSGAVSPLPLFVGRKFVRFSQPQFHKNSLKKEVGAQECSRRGEKERVREIEGYSPRVHGWRAAA